MRKIPSWMPQALGYSISAASLIWLLHGYPIRQELIPAIKDLDWKWVFLAVLSDLAVYVTHGWRWKTVLSPVIRLRFWRTVQAVYIGLFANEVLPLRTGELIRCYLLAHWNDLRLSLSFASAAVERLMDGLFLVAAFLVTVSLVNGIPHDLVLLGKILAGLLIFGVMLLVFITTNKQEAHAVLAENRWSSTLRHVIEGLHLMGNLRSLGIAAAISLLYLVLQVFSVYALMKADEMDLSFWAAFGVLTIIRLWTVVPNAPGNLGLVNAACVAALHLFDVETNVAKTFSIILFGALTLPLLLGGALAVALTGVNISELRNRARQSAQAQTPRAGTL
jgi:glycosyltransferase 2 family protein